MSTSAELKPFNMLGTFSFAVLPGVNYMKTLHETSGHVSKGFQGRTDISHATRS